MRSVCLFVVISTIFNLAKSDIDQYSKTVSHKMPCNSLSEISKDLLEMQNEKNLCIKNTKYNTVKCFKKS